MLSDILQQKKCFKLVCGAGNEDAIEVEKLVSLYALAGANYFDLSAREDVVLAAKKAINNVIPEAERSNYFLNVSVGIKGDPHISKSKIDHEKCIKCGVCSSTCNIQNAIEFKNDMYEVVTKRCIGCGRCVPVCPEKCIGVYSVLKPLSEVLPKLIKLGLNSIELHAVTDDDEGALLQWEEINRLFSGVLSLCTDRSHLGDKQMLARIRSFIANRAPWSTIIQADGAPMSGCDDFASTTLQALATAQIVQRAKLPVFLMMSGGTNSKTTEFAKLFEIEAHGVAIGSYARMIVKEYIDRDDFLSNKEVFNKALVIAKELVENGLKYMGFL